MVILCWLSTKKYRVTLVQIRVRESLSLENIIIRCKMDRISHYSNFPKSFAWNLAKVGLSVDENKLKKTYGGIIPKYLEGIWRAKSCRRLELYFSGEYENH